MRGSEREVLLARTFVEIVDTLVDDFDVVDLLTMVADRCVEVLDISAAGLMLVAPEGTCGSSPSRAKRCAPSSCSSCSPRKGPPWTPSAPAPMVNQDLETVNGRWPRFAPRPSNATSGPCTLSPCVCVASPSVP
jgi:hypothetical protein